MSDEIVTFSFRSVNHPRYRFSESEPFVAEDWKAEVVKRAKFWSERWGGDTVKVLQDDPPIWIGTYYPKTDEFIWE